MFRYDIISDDSLRVREMMKFLFPLAVLCFAAIASADQDRLRLVSDIKPKTEIAEVVGADPYEGLSRNIAEENARGPQGLKHLTVDPVLVGRSRGVRIRPQLSYIVDPEQTRVEQVWVGTAIVYSF